jgi:hypothetical protein
VTPSTTKTSEEQKSILLKLNKSTSGTTLSLDTNEPTASSPLKKPKLPQARSKEGQQHPPPVAAAINAEYKKIKD